MDQPFYEICTMDRARNLAFVLRLFGFAGMLATVAVFMPMSWMAFAHERLGLGPMPTDPVVQYLARSLSAFYALTGALCLVLAGDVRRYRPVIQCLGIAVVVFGIVLVWIGWKSELPWWWTAGEGPPTAVFGAVIFWLAMDPDAGP